MYLEQQIDACYEIIVNTGSILEGRQKLVELSQYFENNVEEFLRLEIVVPLVLHELLLRLDNVRDLSVGLEYLKRIRQNFSTETESFKIFFVLVSCLLYLRLVEGPSDRYNMLYAYCFLCFDYERLEAKLV